MRRQEHYTNKEDLEIINKAYENSPNKINELPAEKFLKNIEWRLYTEFCFDLSHRKGWCNYLFYHGETFKKWIDNETHYEMERLGFNFDEKKGIFKSNELNNTNIIDAYQKIREKVLIALTERAIEFFKPCEEYLWPKENNKRNLRTSLKPYLKNL